MPTVRESTTKQKRTIIAITEYKAGLRLFAMGGSVRFNAIVVSVGKVVDCSGIGVLSVVGREKIHLSDVC